MINDLRRERTEFMMKIKAAVVEKQNADFEIKDDVELAEMGPDDLQVHMVASGICHSDEALRIGDAVIDYPIVLGHEGSGIVEKVGPEVTQFKPGDHVVLSFYGCGNCKSCLKGIPTQCENYAANNLSGVRPDGSAHFTENGHKVADMFDQSSFTSTTVVRERNAVKVDPTLDLRKLGPLGCGYVTGSGTVLNTLKPKPGDTIAVFGTGAVGLAAMMAGRISGCTKVIGIDIVDSRLDLAKELGATDVINSKNVDVVQAVKDLTDGYGVNWAVDTTGVTAVMENSIKVLAQGGTLLPLPSHQTTLTLILGTTFVLTTRRSLASTWAIQFLKLIFHVSSTSTRWVCLTSTRPKNSTNLAKLTKPMLTPAQVKPSNLCW